jgi:hypothetical protein
MLLLAFALLPSAGFQHPSSSLRCQRRPAQCRAILHRTPPVRCCEPAEETPPSPELTKVGSKAYYEGFFSQPIDESVTATRGDGTEQAIKFAASSFVVIAALFVGFMVSNGLLG